MRRGMDRRALGTLSAGHFLVDFPNGALPALIPFFEERFDLSYTLVAVLVLASAISGSLVQPLFGALSDGRGALWLLPAGIGIAGIGMALAAVSPAYALVVLAIVVSGFGTAAFHPEGSKFASFSSGDRRASGMSVFSIGGNFGYALGALALTPMVETFGLHGALLLLVPAAFGTVAVALRLPHLRRLAPDARAAGTPPQTAAGEDRPGAVKLLLVVLLFRSLAWYGMLSFVPLWEVAQGHSKAYGNHLLFAMLIAGAFGTLMAGPTADRIGRRPVLLGSSILSVPAILVFVLVGGIPSIVACMVLGVCVIGTFGVTMVMSQEYLPSRIGMASGLSIGFSIGLGGIAAVALGFVADEIDLRTAFLVCAAAPAVGAVLTLFLPPTRRPRPVEATAELGAPATGALR